MSRNGSGNAGQYSNARSTASGSKPAAASDNSGAGFLIPDLCNATALSLLVLVAELLAVVLVFAGEVSWGRFALLSLFVQWITLTSAGILCSTRRLLARLGVVPGALVAFGIVLTVTLCVGVASDLVLAGGSFTVDLDWSTIRAQLVIAGIIAGLALRYFYVQQQLRQREQAELQSRIQALQSRIRPHFLFNSMNIIASLIATDPEAAEDVVLDLSELFRASLNDAGNQVWLDDELDLCRRYARIEQLRLGDRLQLEWAVAPEVLPRRIRIPLLTLQPLLENAIYHGIQPRPDGGLIHVIVGVAGDSLNVRIRNPLPEDESQSTSEGNRMAIQNIRGRLQALYGSRAGLRNVVSDEHYEVILEIPMDSDSNAHRDGER